MKYNAYPTACELYNMNGQLVKTVKNSDFTNNMDLDVSQQAPRFYIIQIVNQYVIPK